MSDAEYLTTPALARLTGLAHGFFTRRGGVSDGPWAALNCSLSGQDDIGRVRENRRRAMAAFGLDRPALHGLTQVHGPAVAVVDAAGWAEGQGPRADALVTRRAGIALGIVTADCAPVLFADAEAGVIGAAHAGWRGAVAGVLEATVAAMAALGAAPGRIHAAIGPCIGQASYEVGPDLREEVLARDATDARHFGPGRREERWQFDLAGYCAARLARLGLAVVETADTDTLANEERFFSHRRRTLARGGPIGHQLSAIAIPA
ncbi:laccase domain protein [Siccirubricoccus deserti]|uniref:Purine nucleoside phosphorylase n=1 Tax=Siccirubricoccus deserti TaxID=2013562 RepID=A0A9X0QV26_9PROT|nr:peptidoglycan editing factor PgeF [Siccirubricoccus deserti]MBC4013793.1 peptidoglycan editing factor PgeF [Siccirubricoccus deserti]GGC29505.1 laccase domain protein [Siccirubricoccus deserti]